MRISVKQLSILLLLALTSPLSAQNAKRQSGVKPRQPAAPVAALAFRPDGKLLAVGNRSEVLLIDSGSGDLVGRLPGQTAHVTALTYSPDGRQLSVASGEPGKAGEIRFYTTSTKDNTNTAPTHVIKEHKDIIYNLTFSPDGKLLASCGYDRSIKLWDTASAKLVRTLQDHSDTIYGLAFSPDGQLLASAAADRAVKIWEIGTGKRLYTLGESTDWVYAVAWSPDGKRVAAGGVDKSIRVWEASKSGGKIVHSVFGHEGPVNRLTYSTDGKTLYSLGEDRVLKAWITATMTERRVYAKQPETPLSLAVSPDRKVLAVGRYDGVVVLLDEATGRVISEPVPVKPKPPALAKVAPAAVQRGRTTRLTLEGEGLDGVTEIAVSSVGAFKNITRTKSAPGKLQFELAPPATIPAGVYQLRAKSPAGESAPLMITVDPFAAVADHEPNDSPSVGQTIRLPATLVGAIDKAGDVDCFRFEAQAGQEIGVQALTTVLGSKLEPVLFLTDATGILLAESNSGVLGYKVISPGVYALGIRDLSYRGGAGMQYRLHAGDLPVVTSVFPLGLQRGAETEIAVEGVNLGAARSVRVKAPANAELGSKLPVSLNTALGVPLGLASVVVGEFPEITPGDSKSLELIPVPGTANGRISQPGQTKSWRFQAKKGQRLVVETHARRLGSPLDSFIEILDAKGQPLPLATLTCQSKTYLIFRDNDSATSTMRIENWAELAINDYVYVGGELLRILELPKNPDDNCVFYSVAGQRVGYLNTTPTHQSLGLPLYKVSIHPPGTSFPANGMPVFPLIHRNDDGGPPCGKDSRIFFDPPADGEYQVRVGDAAGQGGAAYAYRLTVRAPRPSFQVTFNPTAPSVWKGGGIPVSVSAERFDGFEGAIALQLDHLPKGFSAPATSIPAGEYSTTFSLFADAKATAPAGAPLTLVAKAEIDGKQVMREVRGGLPKIVDTGDIVTTTEQTEVTVEPGKEVRVTAKIERLNDFKGRIPIEVRGLPHGVRVLDIGLNGILITERDTSRSFVIYCEPWVQPTTHPFVVLAKREGKGTEHAARSVLLKVVK